MASTPGAKAADSVCVESLGGKTVEAPKVPALVRQLLLASLGHRLMQLLVGHERLRSKGMLSKCVCVSGRLSVASTPEAKAADSVCVESLCGLRLLHRFLLLLPLLFPKLIPSVTVLGLLPRWARGSSLRAKPNEKHVSSPSNKCTSWLSCCLEGELAICFDCHV